jgi:hypothetical protein
MVTLAGLWDSFSATEVVGIALGWISAFGLLAIAYTKTTRWDHAWKRRWEQRHRASLETLRQKKQSTLKVMTAARWFMLALVFMSVGASFGPVATTIQGLQSQPSLIIVGYAMLNLITLLGLALTAGGVRLLSYQVARLDDLIASDSCR